MKLPKPGQFVVINDVYYRARKSYTCNGCALDNPFTCPNVGRKKRIACRACGIILRPVSEESHSP